MTKEEMDRSKEAEKSTQRRRPYKKWRNSPAKPPQRNNKDLGFFGKIPDVPSLERLQRENRKRTRRHYKRGRPDGRRNLSAAQPQYYVPFVPLTYTSSYPPFYHFPGFHQPYNNRRYQKPQQPLLPPPLTVKHNPFANVEASPAAGQVMTPTALPINAATNSAAAVRPGPTIEDLEGLPADLDFYGTDHGADFLMDLCVSSTDDDEEHSHDGDEDDGGSEDKLHDKHPLMVLPNDQGDDIEFMNLPPQIRARISQQDAIIAELEDENLKLRETLDIAKQEVKRLRKSVLEGRGDDDDANDTTSGEQVVVVGRHFMPSPAGNTNTNRRITRQMSGTPSQQDDHSMAA